MCNRYRSKVDRRRYTDEFGITSYDVFEEDIPREVFPRKPGFIIRDLGGERVLSQARWGLVSHRTKELKPKFQPNNARAETFHSKFPFAPVWKRQRCLIPVDSFFEWHHPDEGKPQLFHLLPKSGRPVAMAGLWDVWEGPDGPVETYTMLTTKASDFMARIHNKGRRMPFILPREHYNDWLDLNNNDPEMLRGLADPNPDLQASAFSTD